jgi:class 3 adenylate cyclase/HAMP domain-containing protein
METSKKKQFFFSLKYKLVLFSAGIAVSCIFFTSLFFLYNSKKLLQKKTLENCENISENIADIAREDLLVDGTYEATNSIVARIQLSETVGLLDVYIVNVYGKYVVNSDSTRLNKFSPSNEISYLQSIKEIDLLEEYSEKLNKTILKITYPIFIQFKGNPMKIGAAVFEYDKDVIYAPIYNMQQIIIFSGLGILFITILATIALASYIMRPMRSLFRGVQIISSGDLNHKIEIQTNDEVGLLSQNFNDMTQSLKEFYVELEQKVEERTADLVKSQSTLLTVLSNAPLLLFSTDMEGRITLAEGKGLSLLGLNNTEPVGQLVKDLFESKEELVNQIPKALQGDAIILQIQYMEWGFEVNLSPLYSVGHIQVGLVILFFDITENLRAKEMIQSERDKTDKLLKNILPEAIADELKNQGTVKPILYPLVTVLFTDFKGFTKIAQKLSPEELLEKLDLIFLQFDQICERRNIEKLKTIGDAYMCAGGLPESNHTHAIDACLAAIEMQSFMKQTKEIVEEISGEEFWDMRLGIHTGTVIAGVIGKTKFAYDVWGDAVNTASRMESNGSIGKINISDDTYDLVKDFFECEHRGKIEAKNRGLMDMYFLLRIRPELSRDKMGTVPNEKFIKLYSNIN